MDREQQTKSAAVEKETPWTDDSIRWTKEELQNHQDKQEHDEQVAADIFRDANPMDTFCFSLPNGLSIEIKGYKSDSDEIWTSTGLTLWKASEHLCRYLVTHSERLLLREDLQILELGAGLGLVGIVASHLAVQNSTVCLTDGDTNALKHVRANAEQNSPPNNTTVSCHQLLWGHDTATSFQEKHGERFDLILASDILYASCVIEPLWQTVRALLTREGVFVMAFATRKVKVTIHDFIAAAKEHFVHKCVDQNDEEGVFVYEFTWAK